MSEEKKPVARDEMSAGPAMIPGDVEAFRARMKSDGKRRLTANSRGEVRHALEIPADLDRWHPNEISEWLTTQEDDEKLSNADVARARKAVSVALGVD